MTMYGKNYQTHVIWPAVDELNLTEINQITTNQRVNVGSLGAPKGLGSLELLPLLAQPCKDPFTVYKSNAHVGFKKLLVWFQTLLIFH